MLSLNVIRYVAQAVADHFEQQLVKAEITDAGMLCVEYKPRTYPDAWGITIFIPEWEDMDTVQLAIQVTQCVTDMLNSQDYQEAIANAECEAWEASQREPQQD